MVHILVPDDMAYLITTAVLRLDKATQIHSLAPPPPSETQPLDGPLDLLTPRNISYTPESTTGSAFIARLPLKPPFNKTTPIFSIKYDAGLAKTEYLLSLTPIYLIRPHCRFNRRNKLAAF